MPPPLTRRPVVRVASAGLDPRDVRLIQIVFEHSQYNKYDYRMLDDLDLTRADILIANPSDPAGLDAMSAVGNRLRPIPTVAAVPRGTQTGARHSIAVDRLTLQLLPILNRVVESEHISGSLDEAEPLTEELTDIHVDPVGERAQGALPAARRPASMRIAAAPGALPPAGPAPRAAALPAAQGRVAEVIARAVDRVASVRAAHGAHPADAATASVPGGATAADPGVHDEPTRPMRHDPRGDGDRRSRPRDPVAVARAPSAPYTAPRLRLLALVVSPSPVAQQQAVRALRRIGLEAHCASGTTSALQLLARQYHDLVVADHGLADGDGFDLVRGIRQMPAYRFTPVLLVRPRTQALDGARARLAGQVVLLTKPLSRGTLEHVVRDTLRHTVILDELSELLVPVGVVA